MAGHPSGLLIISGDEHGQVRFWKVHKQRKWIKPIKVSNWPATRQKWSTVQCLTVSARGTFVAAGGSSDSEKTRGMICLYHIQNQDDIDIDKPMVFRSGDNSNLFAFAGITALCFTVNEMYLLACDLAGTIVCNVIVFSRQRGERKSDEFDLVKVIKSGVNSRINGICTHDQDKYVFCSNGSESYILACQFEQLIDTIEPVVFQRCLRANGDEDKTTGVLSTKHGLFLISKRLQLYQVITNSNGSRKEIILQIDRKTRLPNR
ncbi:hypothetical protein RFI_10217 [Reticulomyxa filosa]|uniref:Uncharacterized protein n=1 Tax=Reticulomyxa filosa TaxID=46433 RepID=X6NML1_RETFI|nr:hypothetical protein RFI_10217 [Reticulomyxa filosa]|eukprot:ETO26914.1 hypothetical protein RFI_10217 [Reticulomyxa filosa]